MQVCERDLFSSVQKNTELRSALMAVAPWGWEVSVCVRGGDGEKGWCEGGVCARLPHGCCTLGVGVEAKMG